MVRNLLLSMVNYTIVIHSLLKYGFLLNRYCWFLAHHEKWIFHSDESKTLYINKIH